VNGSMKRALQSSSGLEYCCGDSALDEPVFHTVNGIECSSASHPVGKIRSAFTPENPSLTWGKVWISFIVTRKRRRPRETSHLRKEDITEPYTYNAYLGAT
jgi:hypothetical protein